MQLIIIKYVSYNYKMKQIINAILSSPQETFLFNLVWCQWNYIRALLHKEVRQ